MISHSRRGGWWSLRTGWVATTRTKAKRLSMSSPAGVVRQGSVCHASAGSRSASERSDSGLRSGRATLRGRPVAPVRLGAEAGVVAVGRVGEDRRRRHFPARSLPAEIGGERRLRLKTDLLRDLRLPPPLTIVAPLLGQVEALAERRRPPLPDRVHADGDLAVADLAKRARVLVLHPRRVLAVLDNPSVVDHPGHHADLGRHPLSARPHQQLRIPRRIGQKLLQRLVPGRRLLQPKQGRLQALPAAMLDQATHVQLGVLPLTPEREVARDFPDERDQALPHLHSRRRDHKRSFHLPALRTKTADADTVRREGGGPFNQLTKSY